MPAFDSLPPLSLGLLVKVVFTWLLGMGVYAFMGGWRRVAARYPDRTLSGGERFRMATVWIGRGSLGTTYGGCVSVEVNSQGIRLSMMAPFRPFHPPFCVPWSAVTGHRRDRFAFVDRTWVSLADTDWCLRFRDPVGKTVEEQFDAEDERSEAIPPPLRW